MDILERQLEQSIYDAWHSDPEKLQELGLELPYKDTRMFKQLDLGAYFI
jgi:hypothetical protein